MKIQKVLATIMLIIILFTTLPINSFAYITDINSNAEFGVISGSFEEYSHELHYAKYEGKTYIVFCTQYGKTSPSGNVYVYGDEFNAKLKSQMPEYEKIAEMIYFGYNLKYGTGLPSSNAAKKAAACTQQYVWETLGDAPARTSWNNLETGDYAEWLNKTKEYYNEYHSTMSFNKETVKLNIGETTTFTDNKLKNYSAFSKTINGVKFVHEDGSNKLKVTATNDSTNGKVIFDSLENKIYENLPNEEKFDSDQMSSYVYFQFKGEVQHLIFSNYVDPTLFKVTIDVQSGDLQLTKTDTDGIPISGCVFGLYSDETCTDKVTEGTSSNSGIIKFEKLAPKTYYLKEESTVEGYILDTTVKKVTVKNGETTKVSLDNKEPTGTITIIKVDSETNTTPQGDATFSGAIYELRAAEDIYNVAKTKKYYSKDELVATREIDRTGRTQDIEKLPLGKYIGKEIKSSERILY